MPLIKGPEAKTKSGIAENIRREIKSGRDPKQSAAIAYSIARKEKGNDMKKQTKADKKDESLGMRRGKESTKTQSYKSRRDESKGASKKK
jgi:hypothetical protein